MRRRLAECAFEEVHRLYSWPVVARQIAGVYGQVRATAPDNDWTLRAPLDPACRYRAAPHCSETAACHATALFLSPHLDDVAFSCGGTLLRLTDDPRWRVVLCTIFTASVPDPQGFALRCQTDKGIPAETDYMALRRAEDAAYATFANVHDTQHWALPGSSAPWLRIPGGFVRGRP